MSRSVSSCAQPIRIESAAGQVADFGMLGGKLGVCDRAWRTEPRTLQKAKAGLQVVLMKSQRVRHAHRPQMSVRRREDCGGFLGSEVEPPDVIDLWEDLREKMARSLGQLQQVSSQLRAGKQAHHGVARLDALLLPLPVPRESDDVRTSHGSIVAAATDSL